MRKLITTIMLLLLFITFPTAYATEMGAGKAETYRLEISILFKTDAEDSDYEEVTFRVYDETEQKYLTFEYSYGEYGYLITGYAESKDDATLLTPYCGDITLALLPNGKYSFENLSVPENFTLLKEKIYVTVTDGAASIRTGNSETETELYIAEDGFISVAVNFTTGIRLPNAVAPEVGIFGVIGVVMMSVGLIGLLLWIFLPKIKERRKAGKYEDNEKEIES